MSCFELARLPTQNQGLLPCNSCRQPHALALTVYQQKRCGSTSYEGSKLPKKQFVLSLEADRFATVYVSCLPKYSKGRSRCYIYLYVAKQTKKLAFPNVSWYGLHHCPSRFKVIPASPDGLVGCFVLAKMWWTRLRVSEARHLCNRPQANRLQKTSH